jgi:hypothetical protein
VSREQQAAQAPESLVHQVLHGYENGHHLIAASVELPRHAEYEMLVLSDLSGPALEPGFETYLTGYPLQGTEYYVLARTWYAEEMARPGCVWTHSFLLQRRVLSRPGVLTALRNEFRRPSEADEQASFAYSDPLHLANGNRAAALPPSNDTLAGRLLTALYGSPESSVVLAASSAEEHEDLICATWEQQWLSLRRRFRFCTGAISDRGGESSRFDLQACPRFSLPVSRTQEGRRILIDREPTVPLVAPWAIVLKADLEAPNAFRVRDFLRSTGSEAPNPRASVAPLARIFIRLAAGLDVNRDLRPMLEDVAEAFPEADTGELFKNSLFGPNSLFHRNADDPARAEETIFRVLCTDEHASALNFQKLELPRRTQELWKRSASARSRLFELLVQTGASPETPLGDAVAEVITPETAEELAHEHPQLLARIAAARPEFLYSAKWWRNGRKRQEELLDAARQLRSIERIDYRAFARAILQEDTRHLAHDVVREFGSDFVVNALEQLDGAPKSAASLPDEWWNALTEGDAWALTWLQAHDRPALPVLLGLMSAIDPKVALRSAIELRKWRHYGELEFTEFRPRVVVEAMALLLTLALQRRDTEAPAAAADAFPWVHNALCDSRLSSRAWMALSELLPAARAGQEWDRAERLRRGLLERFMGADWPLMYLISAARSPVVFRQVWESIESERRFQPLRERVPIELRKASANTSEPLLRVIAERESSQKRVKKKKR